MAKKKSKNKRVKTTTTQKVTKEKVIKGMASPADFGERIANKLFNW